MRKFTILSFIALVFLSIFLLEQLSRANSKLDVNRQKEITLFVKSIEDYNTDLFFISQLLLSYNKDFSNEEKELYVTNLSSYSYRINRIGSNLMILNHLNPVNVYIYEEYIYFMENLLMDMKNLREREMHVIGTVLENYSNILNSQRMKVSREELVTNEKEMRKLLSIINDMNNEISNILHGS